MFITRSHTKLPMTLEVCLVVSHSPRRKLFQVVRFIRHAQRSLGCIRADPQFSLLKHHLRFRAPELVFLCVPNFVHLVFLDELVVNPKVCHLVDVSTADLDGDGVDACAVVFDLI